MLNTFKITESLIKRKRPKFNFKVYHDTPVSPLSKPLSECRLALITTGGLHLKTDRPFDLTLSDGDCSYRTLPDKIRPEGLSIAHKWYNHKFIHADLNCVFPIDRMCEYVKKRTIKSLAEEHYSFMGHIYETKPLIKSAQKVGDRLKKFNVDIVFLTPT